MKDRDSAFMYVRFFSSYLHDGSEQNAEAVRIKWKMQFSCWQNKRIMCGAFCDEIECLFVYFLKSFGALDWYA